MRYAATTRCFTQRTWRISSRSIVLAFPRPPPFEQIGCPSLSAQTEGQRQRQHDTGQDDEKTLADDRSADMCLIDGDQHDESDDGVQRGPAYQRCVLRAR